MSDREARVVAQVQGQVQGVGFRFWVQRRATEVGLAGSAANLPNGNVEVVVEGTRDACQRLLEILRGPDAPGRVCGVSEEWSSPSGDVVDFTTL